MQPSTLTSTVPNGAPCGSGTISTGAGADAHAVRATQAAPRRACRRRRRRSRAWPRRPSARWRAKRCPSASGSSVSIDATRAPAKPRPARIGSRQRDGLARGRRCRGAAWRAVRKRTARRAIGKRRGDRFQSDLRHLVDLRPAARSPAARRRGAPARRSIRRRARRRGTCSTACLPPACAVGGRAACATCAAARRTAAAHRPRRRSGRRRRIGRSRRRSAHRSPRDRRSGVMAPVGQRSRQRRQPTILERECAHRSSVKVT